MNVLVAVFSLFFLTGTALADHAVDNAAETARASYRAADDAELLASLANRDAGWIYERIDLENSAVPEDHRHDTLRQLARAADRLHYSLSDLYRAARYASGGFGPEDHRGDRIRAEYFRAQQDFWEVQRAHRGLQGYRYNNQINRVYYGLEVSMQRLAWTVNGGVYQ